jgi:D-alanine--D-alanine ligase
MVRPGDVVVGMGAGNIAEFAPALLKELARVGARLALPAHVGSSEVGKAGFAPTRVAVIYGGDSAEREVSLLSGREVHAALKGRGYDSKLVDISETLIKTGDLSHFTGDNRPDVAFFAVHGTNAEDGAIQGLFELLHIPYIGSGIQASALAMDKQLTKTRLKEKGIRVPEGVLVTSPDDAVSLKAPVIVKPNAQGSTVGLSFVERDEDVRAAVERALQYDSAALVEEWVVGTEISVPVLGDRVLPVVEIAPVGGKYDFASKYTPGATEEIVPARLPAGVLAEAQSIALRAHTALGCKGATRTDMIVRSLSPLPPSPFSDLSEEPQSLNRRENGEGGVEIFALEVNTLPGMTATSLLPNSARAAGIEFDELVQWLVEDALTRYAAKT